MAVLTVRHYNDTIESFIKNITDSEKSYYVFVGKPTAWPDEQNPPAANGSVDSFDKSVFKDLVYGKKLTNFDVVYMLPRYDWVSGTVYTRYDQDDETIFEKNFFVINDKREIYKCINNNNNGPSTIKPDLPLPYSTFDTADGYTWKYMYTIDINYHEKFSTKDFIPIAANSIGGTYDTNVRGNTVGGTIDAIIVNPLTANEVYNAYHNDFVTAVVNNYVVQLSANASPLKDHYTESALYLKTGWGAGQYSKIQSYNGLTKQVFLYEPIETYEQMEIENISNPQNIVVGQTVAQYSDIIYFNYDTGTFNIGDILYQSNSFATGTIVSVNSTSFRVTKDSNINFNLNLPILPTSQAGVQRTVGTVSVTSGCTVVTGVGTVFKDSANTANSQYQLNQYIKIGNGVVANNNIRRIVSIASNTSLTVDVPFANTLTGNTHFYMPTAAIPTSIQTSESNGIITDVNLNSVTLLVTNSNNMSESFIPGEKVTMVDNNDVSQLANGTVSFSNSSTVILNNVQGPSFQSGFKLFGSSSNLKASINTVAISSRLSVRNPKGKFLSGFGLKIKDTANGSLTVSNAIAKSSLTVPNEMTEYIISPKVNIYGDGNGALAYAIINAVSNTIQSIAVINTGSNYTFANISFSANLQTITQKFL